MSVRLFVWYLNPPNNFILHHSYFISRLLSFSAYFFLNPWTGIVVDVKYWTRSWKGYWISSCELLTTKEGKVDDTVDRSVTILEKSVILGRHCMDLISSSSHLLTITFFSEKLCNVSNLNTSFIQPYPEYSHLMKSENYIIWSYKNRK